MELLHAEVTEVIIGAFYEVYNELGYGFLESVYAKALGRELARRGVQAATEVVVEVIYKGEEVGLFRLDMLVRGVVLVEVKATHEVTKQHMRQLRNYLKAARIEVGLLLHFGPKKAAFFRLVASELLK